MSPAETNTILKKIKSLDKKIDVLIKIVASKKKEEEDWIYDPKIVKMLKEISKESWKDYKAGKLKSVEEIFEELNV